MKMPVLFYLLSKRDSALVHWLLDYFFALEVQTGEYHISRRAGLLYTLKDMAMCVIFNPVVPSASHSGV